MFDCRVCGAYKARRVCRIFALRFRVQAFVAEALILCSALLKPQPSNLNQPLQPTSKTFKAQNLNSHIPKKHIQTPKNQKAPASRGDEKQRRSFGLASKPRNPSGLRV